MPPIHAPRYRAGISLACALCLCATFLMAESPERYSPWSSPTNIAAINSPAGEFFPSVSKDGLSLYLTISTCPSPTATCRADGSGGFDIFVSRRSRTDEPWPPAVNLGPTVNTEYNESGPSISVDGHLMFFASDRPGGFGGNDLYVSWRQQTQDDFGWEPAANLGSGINTAFNESSPEFAAGDSIGGRALYFDSNRPGGLGPFDEEIPARIGNDIYVSALNPDGSFGPAVFLEEVSSIYADRIAAVSRDGRELYLTSNRPGGMGLLDLWVATRTSPSGPWSTPINVAEVNSSSNDAGPALSYDMMTLYFQSGRPGGMGAYDIWETTRSRLTGQGKPVPGLAR
jgi:hypothetical protein